MVARAIGTYELSWHREGQATTSVQPDDEQPTHRRFDMIGLSNFLGTEKREQSPSSTIREDTDADAIGDHEEPLVDGRELIARIVDSFDRGEVSEEHIRALRKSLKLEKSDRTDVKIDNLRSKVDDLEAYADALEAFIDEEGTADQIVTELRADIRDTEKRLERLTTRVDTLETAQSSLNDGVDDLEGDFDQLQGYVEELEGRHSREIMGVDAKIDQTESSMADRLDSVEEEVGSLDQRVAGVEAMETRIADLERDVGELEKLESAVTEMGSELSELRPLQDRIQQVEDEVDSLSALEERALQVPQLANRVEKLEGLPKEIDALETDLEELNDFKAKLIDTVNPPGASRSHD